MEKGRLRINGRLRKAENEILHKSIPKPTLEIEDAYTQNTFPKDFSWRERRAKREGR